MLCLLVCSEWSEKSRGIYFKHDYVPVNELFQPPTLPSLSLLPPLSPSILFSLLLFLVTHTYITYHCFSNLSLHRNNRYYHTAYTFTPYSDRTKTTVMKIFCGIFIYIYVCSFISIFFQARKKKVHEFFKHFQFYCKS